MRFRVETRGFILPGDGSEPDPQTLDALTDLVQDQLMKLDGAIDPDLTASLKSGELTLRACVEAGGHEEALKLAESIFRAALHAAEIGTPEWEPPTKAEYRVEEVDWHVSKIDDLIDA